MHREILRIMNWAGTIRVRQNVDFALLEHFRGRRSYVALSALWLGWWFTQPGARWSRWSRTRFGLGYSVTTFQVFLN